MFYRSGGLDLVGDKEGKKFLVRTKRVIGTGMRVCSCKATRRFVHHGRNGILSNHASKLSNHASKVRRQQAFFLPTAFRTEHVVGKVHM